MLARRNLRTDELFSTKAEQRSPLRREYGQPKKALSDPMRYYDPKYYEAAVR